VKRRHLFDKGYPVASATLIAGSQVLLAVASGALRTSSGRLASSRMLLGDSSQRLLNTLARCGCSRAELSEPRDNYVYRGPQPSEKAARQEPQDRPASAQPHHR
jgi:hypothetical protein